MFAPIGGRTGIAVIGIVTLAAVLAGLWFFVDGFSAGVIDYLNLHGGYAPLIMAALAVLAFLIGFTLRKMDPYVMGMGVIIVIATLILLLLPMTIGA